MSPRGFMATRIHITELLGVSPLSKLDMAEKIENGLPLDQVQRLRDAGLTFSEVSELVISPRTLKHRKSRGETLSPEEAERALRVSRLLSRAEDVFGELEPALIWLRAPSDKLNGRTPLSMLRTEPGGSLVDEMLWQIEEGMYT
jgi:putative toxin-antitoxin system antitoxin component (TIGR02293 family)